MIERERPAESFFRAQAQGFLNPRTNQAQGALHALRIQCRRLRRPHALAVTLKQNAAQQSFELGNRLGYCGLRKKDPACRLADAVLCRDFAKRSQMAQVSQRGRHLIGLHGKGFYNKILCRFAKIGMQRICQT
ncbi:MAG TPA: hypothetical protein VEI05_02575 [Burkholderiaceae bacterium]|nr:hypothetical protein [Burkholderiaceae bacterium]